MIGRVLRAALPALLALLTVNDAALFARVMLARRAFGATIATPAGAASRGAFPAPDGFGPSGERVDLPRRRLGVVVRYAGSRCPYSKNDPEWSRLSERLRELNVPVIVLVPSLEDQFPPTGLPVPPRQEAYVNIDWLRRYPVLVTPTLLVFDGENRLVWRHVGQLGPKSLAAAVAALKAANGAK